MSAKVSFNQPLKSLTFCGGENIAALFDNDIQLAWSSTETHFSTIEVDRSSSDVFGTCDCKCIMQFIKKRTVISAIFVTDKTTGINRLDLHSSNLIPIFGLQDEEFSAACRNDDTEMMFAATWNKHSKRTTVKMIDPRTPNGISDILSVSSYTKIELGSGKSSNSSSKWNTIDDFATAELLWVMWNCLICEIFGAAQSWWVKSSCSVCVSVLADFLICWYPRKSKKFIPYPHSASFDLPKRSIEVEKWTLFLQKIEIKGELWSKKCRNSIHFNHICTK